MDIESTKEQLERKRKEVINLALQAKTSEEIEKQLYLSQSQVAKFLKELSQQQITICGVDLAKGADCCTMAKCRRT